MFTLSEFATRNCNHLSNKEDVDRVAKAKDILANKNDQEEGIPKKSPVVEDTIPKKHLVVVEEAIPKDKNSKSKESLAESGKSKEELFAKTHRIIQVSINNLQRLISLVLIFLLRQSYVLRLMSYVLCLIYSLQELFSALAKKDEDGSGKHTGWE